MLSEAVEKAKALGAFPHEAYAIIKGNRVEQVEKRIRARLEEKERLFVARWYSEEARERLREAMEKF